MRPLLLGVGLVVCALMVWQWPAAIDLHLFLNAARNWMEGRSRLYDAGSPGFFYLPWSLALFAPLAVLPAPLAAGLWTALTLASIVYAAASFQAGAMRTWLALLNLHTFSLVLLGQFDALTLLGVTLGWLGVQRRWPQMLSIGLWLMMMKPVNAIVPALLLVWAMRGWRRREWLSALSWPLLSLAASFVVFGADWPLRYLAHTRADPPSANPISTVWNAAGALGVPWPVIALLCAAALGGLWWRVQQRGVEAPTFGLGLATALAVTPYALSAHYVLLTPALAQIRGRVGLLVVFALAWLPLLRAAFGVRAIWVEALYPLAMLTACWLNGSPSPRRAIGGVESAAGGEV
jgi:hypothetical protein